VTPRGAALVHALDGRAAAGGGPGWAAALAGALAEHGPTTLVVPTGGDLVDLDRWVPAGRARPTLAVHEPSRSRGGDLRQAWADRGDRLTVVQSPHPPRATASPRSAVLVDFPLTAVDGLADRLRLARYRWVIANSAFTARWVERRWGRAATVLHPQVLPVAAGAKAPVVLSVGRFTGGTRTKGQLELVEAFRRLGPDVHRTWSLHLAGYVADVEHLEAVRAAAAGLPVHLHPDCDRTTLESLYGRASIYWHACGVGVDPDRHPERLEHFGISVVEAMSAGAAPLVLDAGGPAATVHDVAPTWHDVDDLVTRTRTLVDSPSSLEGTAWRAQERARRFGRRPFGATVATTFSAVLPG
jgi:glycosyltransferase involved in cell wall biosynthesis